MCGKLAYVELSYYDYKPVRKVRRELEDLIPNLDDISICRNYSDETISKIFDELVVENPDIYVPEKDGTLRKTSLFNMMEEKMLFRTV